MLQAFARWFRSPAGILHTIVLVSVIVVAETVFPNFDPHGFWLLYWLTVYSAVTQPILAYVADASGNEELKLIKEELQILRQLQDAVEEK
jgi:hypothetical protein